MIQISFNSNDGKLLSSTDERAEIERKGTGYEWVVLSVTTVGALISIYPGISVAHIAS